MSGSGMQKRPMTEQRAIKLVEAQHGSLEEFAIFCLTTGRDVLDPSENPLKRKKLARVPLSAVETLSQSAKFRKLMRAHVVNRTFGVMEEVAHVEEVVKIALNKGRVVASPRGEAVRVDNTERAVIEAGRYLEERRDLALSTKEAGTKVGVQVVFVGAADGDSRTVDAYGQTIPTEGRPTLSGEVIEVHRPLLPGQAPPEGALARQRKALSLDGPVDVPAHVGSDLDFETDDSPTAKGPTAASRSVRESRNGEPGVGGNVPALSGGGGRGSAPALRLKLGED